MVKLSHSVRTNNTVAFEMQEIARKPTHMFQNSISTPNDLVKRFLDLASANFTFVERWNDPIITSSTFRVYSKKVPVADAAKLFVDKVRNEFVHSPSDLIVTKAMDMFQGKISERKILNFQELLISKPNFLQNYVFSWSCV